MPMATNTTEHREPPPLNEDDQRQFDTDHEIACVPNGDDTWTAHCACGTSATPRRTPGAARNGLNQHLANLNYAIRVARAAPPLSPSTLARLHVIFDAPDVHATFKRRQDMRQAMTQRGVPSPEEVEAFRSGVNDGWSRAQLAEWGVPWPAPARWREDLEQRYNDWRRDGR